MTASTERADPLETGMLIGGRHVFEVDKIEVRNPADRAEIVGTVSRGTELHVDAAVREARAAWPGWHALGFEARAEAISGALDAIEAAAERLCVLYTRENGKTLGAARAEFAAMLRRERNTLGYASRLSSIREFPFAAGVSKVGLRPFGVVAAIAPWNGPVVLGFTQIISALLAGNTIVAKPPETCPLTLVECLGMLAARLPPGVVNILAGGRRDVGNALVGHPGVDKIAFTGSIEAAREIIALSGRTIKNLTLELGGNDPAIILDDLVFDETVMSRLAGSVFRNCGQICLAVKRIYVPRRRLAEFADAFRMAAGRFIVGNGLTPDVDIGPVHSRASLERIERLTTDALDRRAKVESCGVLHSQADPSVGNFMLPRVVLDAPDAAAIVVEEQFAPIVPILAYDTEHEVLARANDTVFGLGGSVWSSDPDRAERLAWQLEAGTVWVNNHGTNFLNPEAPYGGIKQSGIGRKSGIEGVMEYAQLQTLTR